MQISKPVQTPLPIEAALEQGATLLLSISGGKDSQAMTSALVDLHRARGYTGEIILIHADLGAMERTETLPFIRRQAATLGLELVILTRDLLEGIEARYERLLEQGREDVVPFPDAKNRYCTSDYKRNPITKWIRNRFPHDATVICAMGLRADESRARAKKPLYQLRAGCNAPTKGRVVWDWNPIHDWSLADVWQEIGYSLAELEEIQFDGTHLSEKHYGNLKEYAYHIGFNAHPAYAGGNERLSCAMCILGCKIDLKNGAYNRPDTYRRLVDLELKSGKSFRAGLWLASIAPHLLTANQRIAAIERGIIQL